jgi:hypothetical protein
VGRRRLLWALGSAVAVGIAFLVDGVQGRGARPRREVLDRRIDSQVPGDRGTGRAAPIGADGPALRVVLVRVNAEDPERAQTRVSIGDREWLVPISRWTGERQHDAALDARRDVVFADVEAHVRALREADPTRSAEIDALPPHPGAVPHADATKVLDALLAAGVVDVDFSGARSPLPRRR